MTAHGSPTIAPTTRPPMHVTATPRQPMPRRTPARRRRATRATRRPIPRPTRRQATRPTPRTPRPRIPTRPQRPMSMQRPSTEKPVAVAAVAVAIPVPVATTDVAVAPTAPRNHRRCTALAIAAAVLKAQTAVTEAATVDAEAAPATTAPEAEANFAALIASRDARGRQSRREKKTSAADATTASTAEVKSEDKTKTTETTSAQPADAAAASTVGKDAKPGDKLVDGVATDADRSLHRKLQSLRLALPMTRRTEHTAQAAVPDVAAPTTNSLQQQPLQTTPTPIAAADPAT